MEAANSGKNLRVIGVDHWKGSAFEPKLRDEAATFDLRTECIANCRRANYPHWVLITGESVEVAARDFPPLDFVFLDASHDPDSVAADIRAWLPKVKPGGIIGGHDAYVRGVSQAYTAILGEITVTEYCWWKAV